MASNLTPAQIASDSEFDEKFPNELVHMWASGKRGVLPRKDDLKDFMHTRDTAIRAEVYEEVLKKVESKMLADILFIGEQLPDINANDKRPKYIMLGTPSELLALIKQPS